MEIASQKAKQAAHEIASAAAAAEAQRRAASAESATSDADCWIQRLDIRTGEWGF